MWISAQVAGVDAWALEAPQNLPRMTGERRSGASMGVWNDDVDVCAGATPPHLDGPLSSDAAVLRQQVCTLLGRTSGTLGPRLEALITDTADIIGRASDLADHVVQDRIRDLLDGVNEARALADRNTLPSGSSGDRAADRAFMDMLKPPSTPAVRGEMRFGDRCSRGSEAPECTGDDPNSPMPNIFGMVQQSAKFDRYVQNFVLPAMRRSSAAREAWGRAQTVANTPPFTGLEIREVDPELGRTGANGYAAPERQADGSYKMVIYLNPDADPVEAVSVVAHEAHHVSTMARTANITGNASDPPGPIWQAYERQQNFQRVERESGTLYRTYRTIQCLQSRPRPSEGCPNNPNDARSAAGLPEAEVLTVDSARDGYGSALLRACENVNSTLRSYGRPDTELVACPTGVAASPTIFRPTSSLYFAVLGRLSQLPSLIPTTPADSWNPAVRRGQLDDLQQLGSSLVGAHNNYQASKAWDDYVEGNLTNAASYDWTGGCRPSYLPDGVTCDGLATATCPVSGEACPLSGFNWPTIRDRYQNARREYNASSTAIAQHNVIDEYPAHAISWQVMAELGLEVPSLCNRVATYTGASRTVRSMAEVYRRERADFVCGRYLCKNIAVPYTAHMSEHGSGIDRSRIFGSTTSNTISMTTDMTNSLRCYDGWRTGDYSTCAAAGMPERVPTSPRTLDASTFAGCTGAPTTAPAVETDCTPYVGAHSEGDGHAH